MLGFAAQILARQVYVWFSLIPFPGAKGQYDAEHERRMQEFRSAVQAQGVSA